jgi:hypothetical protein
MFVLNNLLFKFSDFVQNTVVIVIKNLAKNKKEKIELEKFYKLGWSTAFIVMQLSDIDMLLGSLVEEKQEVFY